MVVPNLDSSLLPRITALLYLFSSRCIQYVLSTLCRCNIINDRSIGIGSPRTDDAIHA